MRRIQYLEYLKQVSVFFLIKLKFNGNIEEATTLSLPKVSAWAELGIFSKNLYIWRVVGKYSKTGCHCKTSLSNCQAIYNPISLKICQCPNSKSPFFKNDGAMPSVVRLKCWITISLNPNNSEKGHIVDAFFIIRFRDCMLCCATHFLTSAANYSLLVCKFIWIKVSESIFLILKKYHIFEFTTSGIWNDVGRRKKNGGTNKK